VTHYTLTLAEFYSVRLKVLGGGSVNFSIKARLCIFGSKYDLRVQKVGVTLLGGNLHEKDLRSYFILKLKSL
jgi:hypothetical protein